MATNTPNYNLTKPDGSEVPDISVINSNMDKIDSRMKITSDAMAALAARTTALEGVQNVTWNSDDRIWHDKPSGYYYQGDIGTGYPMPYGMVLHMKSSASTRYIAQVFVSGNGVLRIRAMNQTGSMDWVTIS